MAEQGSRGGSDEDRPSVTPQTLSDDWAETTGKRREKARAPGSHVGPYVLLDKIGAGGMGAVYAAYDPKLDRKIALKVLRSAGYDESVSIAGLRLASEGRALARVAHPNVVAVYDVGTIDDEVFVAMELVEGLTLTQWRRVSERRWPEVVDMFCGIAAGLVAVHGAGFVHRDVKPDNILIDNDGRPRVTDFGLARPEGETPAALQQGEQAIVDAEPPSERLQLTQTGARLGTPAYMASEQLNGQPATTKSDQFAFCVALWETLYGERPFEGGSWVSLMMSVTEGQLREPKVSASNRPVPTWLRRCLERGLQPQPDDRWPSMRALRDALRAGDPRRARRRWLVGGTLALAGCALATNVAWQRESSRREAELGCATQGDAVHAIWSTDARARVRAAFQRSKIDDALGIEASVESVFDAFADAWATERAEVCIAALDDRDSVVLERRAHCLDGRLEVLETLISTFSDGDDIVVSRARRTSESLADLGACSDDERLARSTPPPENLDTRREVRRIDRALMQTLVHEHVGHYDEGLRRTRALLRSAESIGYPPTLALAHYRVAVFEEKLGHYPEAVAQWVASFRNASLCGDDDLAAQAAGALAFTEGHQLSRTATGIRWSELAGIMLERLGKTKTLDEARRLDILAVLTESDGRLDDAVALHQQSLALRESLVPSTHQSIGYGLANLAGVYQNQGRLRDAEQALLRSRAIFENAFGPDNPTTAHVINNLANVYREQKRFDESEQLTLRVLDNWVARLGPEHPDVGDVHRSLGDIDVGRGHPANAIVHYREALRIHAQGSAHDHGKTALRLAEVLELLGRADAAKQAFSEALAADESMSSNRQARIQLGLGWIAFDRGTTDAADVHFQRAQGLVEGARDSAKTQARAAIGLAVLARPFDPRPLRTIADDVELPNETRAEALGWLGIRGGSFDRAMFDELMGSVEHDDVLQIRRAIDAQGQRWIKDPP